MIKKISFGIFILSFFAITSFFFLGRVFVVQAQNSALDQARDDEATLRKRLAELELEIAKQQTELENQKGQSQSIQGEISIIRGEINQTKLEIERKNTLIKQLSGQITEKSATIQKLNQELEREKASLGQLLRQMDEIDSLTLFEIMLSQQTLSEYFLDRDNFMVIQESLQDSFTKIRTVQSATDQAKKSLEDQKNKEDDVKFALEEDRKKVEQQESEQKQLLAVSQAKEKTYEQVIAERQAQAAQIRARLFELAGGVQGGGIPFGDAVTYATEASQKTGVRTALILAILSQESDLGKNVGTCNRPGDARTWRDIMPGPGQSWRDDQAAFLQITKELGISPDGQPLSCPVASGGWGGAMGPSQFIPTTWLSVRSEVARLVQTTLANPWNPRHAVFATAVYMRDLGAAAGGYTAERNAACKYYSGRSCGQSSLPNTFYGDSVVAKANALQRDIDFLKEN